MSVWKETFDKVLARYTALKAGRPRSVTKIKLYGNTEPFHRDDHSNQHYPVGRWDRGLASNFFTLGVDRMAKDRSDLGESPPYIRGDLPSDPYEQFWTCDSGLLAYRDPTKKAYVLLEIESNTIAIVPFELRQDRVVRRLRLSDSTMVIEWSEKKAYHKLNDIESVHRHFVSAFDVVTVVPQHRKDSRYRVDFRNEWKMHFLGFPLESQDLWLSAHSKSHYAVYSWRKNQSLWGEDEPLESLSVWDFSKASDALEHGAEASHSVRLVKSLTYKELDHLTIRQGTHPALRRIGLDERMVYFFEEASRHERGPHAGYRPSRDVWVDFFWERTVGLPITGHGPALVSYWGHKQGFSSEILRPPARKVSGRHGSSLGCQPTEDKTAGILFYTNESGCCRRLCLEHEKWCSAVNLKDHGWDPCTRIYADERWLVMQCGESLKILRFDHHAGNRGLSLVE